MTKLTEHFTLEEMTITQIRSVRNVPPPEALDNLKRTAEYMEKVRDLLKFPIHINSGYRSPGVNKLVGGSPRSAHMRGNAVDFICPRFGSPLGICHAIENSLLNFDQLIEEGTWVHISFEEPWRRQVLTKTIDGYARGLKPEGGVT